MSGFDAYPLLPTTSVTTEGQMEHSLPGQVVYLQEQVTVLQNRLAISETEAQTDALTGLPNRRASEARVADLIARHIPLSVVQFDVVKFKTINDEYSAHLGDKVLLLVGHVLQGQVRVRDGLDAMVGRRGGDEFDAVAAKITRDGKPFEGNLGQLIIERAVTKFTTHPIIEALNEGREASGRIGLRGNSVELTAEEAAELTPAQIFDLADPKHGADKPQLSEAKIAEIDRLAAAIDLEVMPPHTTAY